MTNKQIMKEFKDSKLEIINEELLEQYIYFCTSNNLKTKQTGTALHHILPAKIYDNYKDLRKNRWNGTHLTYENHYIAHAILAEAINHPSIIGAWWGMNNKDRVTKNTDGVTILGPEKYAYLFSKAVEIQSKRMKGKVTCKLKSNPEKTIIVNKSEYDKNRHLYLANTEGKLTVINKLTNRKIQINKSEYNKDIHLFHKTGVKRNKESILKEKETKKIIGNDGLNIAQRAAKKGYITLRSKYTEKEWKERCLSLGKHKAEHPRAARINIYNAEGKVMFECKGNIKDVIRDNNLPGSLIASYRKERKIGVEKNAITRMINKGQEKYLGWYALKIK